MSELHISIPDQQPRLEVAICQFIKDEFGQEVEFSKQSATDEIHKDAAAIAGIIWQGLIAITVLETTLQFAERVKRMERVKKLLTAIKKSGKSVYLKIDKEPAVDISQKSTDEMMDLLVKRDGKNRHS